MLSAMALGPLELIVLSFPAARLNDGVLATLDQLLLAPGVRVLDVLVVRTDAMGGACAVELHELPGLGCDPQTQARLATGLITETDVDEVGQLVDEETDALAVLSLLGLLAAMFIPRKPPAGATPGSPATGEAAA